MSLATDLLERLKSLKPESLKSYIFEIAIALFLLSYFLVASSLSFEKEGTWLDIAAGAVLMTLPMVLAWGFAKSIRKKRHQVKLGYIKEPSPVYVVLFLFLAGLVFLAMWYVMYYNTPSRPRPSPSSVTSTPSPPITETEPTTTTTPPSTPQTATAQPNTLTPSPSATNTEANAEPTVTPTPTPTPSASSEESGMQKHYALIRPILKAALWGFGWAFLVGAIALAGITARAEKYKKELEELYLHNLVRKAITQVQQSLRRVQPQDGGTETRIRDVSLEVEEVEVIDKPKKRIVIIAREKAVGRQHPRLARDYSEPEEPTRYRIEANLDGYPVSVKKLS